jgi:hypothetical protein
VLFSRENSGGGKVVRLEAFRAELSSWQTFYFMLGSAAAALIGLMLVALSLGIRLATETTLTDIKAFATPSVLYFVWVLMLSAVMLIPAQSHVFLSVVLLPSGIVGIAMAYPYVRRLIQVAIEHRDFLLSDWLAQIILPTAGFALLVLVALGFLADQTPLAFDGIALASISLMIAAITNTWSMVVWIIERQNAKDGERT